MELREFLERHSWAFKVYKGITGLSAKIHWTRTQAFINGGVYYKLQERDHDKIRSILLKDYLIILTRRKCHLTTYLIALASWFSTGKPSHYTHALMNVEGDITNHMDYKLIESTSPGVHWSTFMEVFDCDSVVLLKPKGIPLSEWTICLDTVKSEYGKKYDILFDVHQDKQVSCVEMVYQGLKKLPNFEMQFPKLIKLVEKFDAVEPQMLRDCGELEIVFEIKR